MSDRSETKILRGILSALRSIGDEIRSGSQNKKVAENNNKAPFSVEIASELRLPVAITEHYRSQNKRWKSIWEKLKPVLEILTFTGAAVAAYYTARTFNQIKRQTDIANSQWQDLRHNFAVEQRAWVGVDRVDSSGSLSREQNLYSYHLRITFRNTGKTPALRLGIGIKLANQGDAALVDERVWNRAFPEFNIPVESVGEVIAPEGTFEYDIPGIRTRTKDEHGNAIANFVLGRLSYDDIFRGGRHTTAFCIVHIAGDRFVPCLYGNSMD